MTLQFRCRVIFFVPHGTGWAVCVTRSRPGNGDPAENRYYGDSTRRFRPHPSLARHLPHPGEGYCGDSVRHRDSADSSVRLRSRTEKIRTAEGSLPPGGEGGQVII